MGVRTYDFNKYKLIMGGVPIHGFADGTGIMMERSEDMFSKVSGADGKVSRAKSNDFTGRLTVTLKQTSPSNDFLSGIAELDETTNDGVIPVILKDFNGTTIATSTAAWCVKKPNVELSKEITNREWIFDMADLTYHVGSNPED